MSQITTHILDTTKGKPAAGVTIALLQQTGDNWQEIARGATNSDGRIADLLPKETQLELGVYKMKFFTKEYFDQNGTANFYPLVEIIFDVATTEHYHVPLLLNPFGYATYRGS
ncbi:hydroxyisourate hydrolase [Hymenobacter sp. BT770]|uniref:hydroxyisourate hydrolase n=1 Tax=Hymenobacter sp. BT770 TaxID=2886942 RepID=UPI001D114CEC|nr:hydroxyisourate hydrolase [Hymenobacter sp. BT770]MCC3153841.1 hydroxyisourate hydrolase [Hymenobacter sp. BT770]MDO3415985.1 hydroxyisourate hydrolase [Hymenobacter sp. BT770]